MPFLRAISLVVLLCAPASALAGPWMREAGETFLSFSVETDFENGITDGSGFYGSIYIERGLTARLTLGLDAGGHDRDFAKAIAFLRWPLRETDRSTRLAAEIGMGFARDTFALRPGISFGKGLSAGDMPGWLAVESRAIFIDSFDGLLETDITLGLKPNPRTKLIVQLQTGAPWGADPYAKIAPSYVHEWKPGHHLEVGFVAGVAEANDFKLKFGFWHKF